MASGDTSFGRCESIAGGDKDASRTERETTQETKRKEMKERVIGQRVGRLERCGWMN